jgi:DNA-binding response OmpR family regulator
MWSSDRAEQTVIVVCPPVDARLDLICEWLVEHGYSPLPAATAAAAAHLCRYTRPSLLVVDLDLPDDSGLELLRGRAEADRRNVSVLLLIDGGFDFRPLMWRDPLLAVDDTLRKPSDLDELGGRIAAILRRRHSRGDAVVRVGELLVDPPRRKILVPDRIVRGLVARSTSETNRLDELKEEYDRILAEHEAWVALLAHLDTAPDAGAAAAAGGGDGRDALPESPDDAGPVASDPEVGQTDQGERSTRVKLDGRLSDDQLRILRREVTGMLAGRAGDLPILSKHPDAGRQFSEIAALARLAFWLERGEVRVPDRVALDVLVRQAESSAELNEYEELRERYEAGIAEHGALVAFAAIFSEDSPSGSGEPR